MRLIATCMASNEAGIIEAFVRHNLGLLDALVVLDHGSLDATHEILERVVDGLVAEALHAYLGYAVTDAELVDDALPCAYELS